MSQITVAINSRNYQISCDDGQEDHLRGLADYVDRRIAELISIMGQVGETRLLVIASLLMADEASAARRDVEELEQSHRGSDSQAAVAEISMAAGLAALAERIENIAATLERT